MKSSIVKRVIAAAFIMLVPVVVQAAQTITPFQNQLGQPAWTFNVPVQVDHIPAIYESKMGVQCVVTARGGEAIGKGGALVPLSFGAYNGIVVVHAYPLAGKDPSLGTQWQCFLGFGNPSGFLAAVDPTGLDKLAAPKPNTPYTILLSGSL